MRDGLYFVPAQGHSIEFLEFHTGRRRTVFSADKLIKDVNVSPDGQAILYSQSDIPSGDLMLLENFR